MQRSSKLDRGSTTENVKTHYLSDCTDLHSHTLLCSSCLQLEFLLAATLLALLGCCLTVTPKTVLGVSTAVLSTVFLDSTVLRWFVDLVWLSATALLALLRGCLAITTKTVFRGHTLVHCAVLLDSPVLRRLVSHVGFRLDELATYTVSATWRRQYVRRVCGLCKWHVYTAMGEYADRERLTCLNLLPVAFSATLTCTFMSNEDTLHEVHCQ